MRDGRIAGQQQRPDQEHGKWFVCRLAKSRHPQAILRARERLRLYLPIERANFPTDWPVHHDVPVFWQELGKTVAAFGQLESTLADTCYSLLMTGTSAAELKSASDDEVRQWYNRVLRSQTDSLHGLTQELERVLEADGRVSFSVRKSLVDRLEELRPFRNAVCHAARVRIQEDGPASLLHVYKNAGLPVPFRQTRDIQDLADIRSRIVDMVFRVAEAASDAGAGFVLMVDSKRVIPAVSTRFQHPAALLLSHWVRL